MSNFFKNTYWWILLLAFFLVAIPSLNLGWSLVDDGKSAQIAFELSESIKNFDIQRFVATILEPESGRFRPGYWIFIWFTFLFGGTNFHIHHAIHLALLVVVLGLIFHFGKSFSNKKSVGFIAAILFLIDWRLLENWYRLGTQEPITLPILLASLYLFMQFREKADITKITIPVFLIVYALTVKETNLAYIGVVGYVFIADLILKNRNNIRRNFIYLAIVLLASVSLRFLSTSLYSTKGYASLYEISYQSIVNNLNNYISTIRSGYSPLLEFSLFVLLIRVLYFLKDKKMNGLIKNYYWHGLWLFWFLSFFIIQIPWGFTFGRYLLIAMVGLQLLMAESVVFSIGVVDYLLKYKTIKDRLDILTFLRLTKLSIIFTLFVIIIYHLFMSLNYIYWVTRIDSFNNGFIKAIIQHTPNGGSVYLNAEHILNPPLELYYEIDWHLDYLHNKSNINYGYLEKDTILQNGDLIAFHVATPVIDENNFQNIDSYKKVSEYDLNASNYNINVSPSGVMKILMRAPIMGFDSYDNLSIVVKNENKYRWVIYQVL